MASNPLAGRNADDRPRPGSEDERRPIYVHPGLVLASAGPAQFTTVVGSCVSVCLWDARLRLGGMNHFLLPLSEGRLGPSTRFGKAAIESLIAELVGLGSRTGDLTAKLFGGAAVIEALCRGQEAHLGARNVQLARCVLAQRGIPIVAEDVLGRRGRKVVFDTGSGAVLVRLI